MTEDIYIGHLELKTYPPPKVALDRAKEASAKERSLIRLREQVNFFLLCITMI